MTATLYSLEPDELNTVIAALRFYQKNGQCDPETRDPAIDDIVTNLGTDVSLDEGAIDDLCERLNSGEDLAPPAFAAGEVVHLTLPGGVTGDDQDGAEHTLCADDLASIRCTVVRVDYLVGEQGWQYDVSIPVGAGLTDAEGDPLTITAAIDDTDRDADGNLPIKRVAVPNALQGRKAGPR